MNAWRAAGERAGKSTLGRLAIEQMIYWQRVWTLGFHALRMRREHKEGGA